METYQNEDVEDVAQQEGKESKDIDYLMSFSSLNAITKSALSNPN